MVIIKSIFLSFFIPNDNYVSVKMTANGQAAAMLEFLISGPELKPITVRPVGTVSLIFSIRQSLVVV